MNSNDHLLPPGLPSTWPCTVPPQRPTIAPVHTRYAGGIFGLQKRRHILQTVCQLPLSLSMEFSSARPSALLGSPRWLPFRYNSSQGFGTVRCWPGLRDGRMLDGFLSWNTERLGCNSEGCEGSCVMQSLYGDPPYIVDMKLPIIALHIHSTYFYCRSSDIWPTTLWPESSAESSVPAWSLFCAQFQQKIRRNPDESGTRGRRPVCRHERRTTSPCKDEMPRHNRSSASSNGRDNRCVPSTGYRTILGHHFVS